MKWLEALKAEIETKRVSQNQLARDLGVSPAMLSQVIRGKYPGSTDTLQARVEGRLLKKTIYCPARGEIGVDECADHQAKPFSSANRERVKMYRACRSGCPHSALDATAKAQRIDVRQSSEEEMYNLENQLAFIKRSGAESPNRLIELYEKELSRLATRYNQLLWSSKYARRN